MREARFKAGDTVYIRDKASPKDRDYSRHVQGGFKIVKAVVQEVHDHPGRAPFYPHGEGYAFNYRGVGPEPAEGDEPHLWWDCYPGCRVWATREEALGARLSEEWIRRYFYGPLVCPECGCTRDKDIHRFGYSCDYYTRPRLKEKS